MAGVTATLAWEGIIVPGGYVDIHNVSGGPSIVTEEFPQGRWLVKLYYYKNLAARQANINNKIPIDDLSYTQFEMPYVHGSDPVDAALTVVNSWFADGAIVE